MDFDDAAIHPDDGGGDSARRVCVQGGGLPVLLVWTTEFGRTPFNTGKDAKGHEHYAEAFTSWMVGGGVKGGISYGESDDYGCSVAANEVHIHDFHATILHLLGLNHERLTYRHAGRDF